GFLPGLVGQRAIAGFADCFQLRLGCARTMTVDDEPRRQKSHGRYGIFLREMTATLTQRPDLIQVTYKVSSDKLLDPEKKAKAITLGQTTDTWTPTEMSGKKKLAKHTGVVLGIDERTHVAGKNYEYHLTIGFPPANTEGDIPSLL